MTCKKGNLDFGATQKFKIWPRPIFRPRTDDVCHQKPNSSREKVPLSRCEVKMSFKKWAKQELEKIQSMACNPTEAPPRKSLRTHLVIFNNWRVFHLWTLLEKNSTHVLQCTGRWSLRDEKEWRGRGGCLQITGCCSLILHKRALCFNRRTTLYPDHSARRHSCWSLPLRNHSFFV